MESEVDALAALEERIHRAVELVATLRAERDAALAQVGATDQLLAERKQVRARIEKLLGQLDAL